MKSKGMTSRKREMQFQIKGKLSEISDLEKAIGAARPKTADKAGLCPRCDTISMVYEGRTPQGGMSGGDDVYTCNICGHCSIDDYWIGDDLKGVGYDKSAASVLKKL